MFPGGSASCAVVGATKVGGSKTTGCQITRILRLLVDWDLAASITNLSAFAFGGLNDPLSANFAIN